MKQWEVARRLRHVSVALIRVVLVLVAALAVPLGLTASAGAAPDPGPGPGPDKVTVGAFINDLQDILRASNELRHEREKFVGSRNRKLYELDEAAQVSMLHTHCLLIN